MQVAGVKAERDSAVGFVEDRGLSPHRPIAAESPLIESQALRDCVRPTLVEPGTTGGREALGARIADVGLRGLQAVPVGRRFGAVCIDRDEFSIYVVDAGVGQELLDDPLRTFVARPRRIRDVESDSCASTK